MDLNFRVLGVGWILFAVVAALGASPGPASAQPILYETVALSGESAPGTPPGVSFRGFGRPALNAAGEVAFLGLLVGAGVVPDNDSGVWTPDASGNPRLLAREGSQATGLPSGVVYVLSSPTLTDSRGTSVSGAVDGAGVTLNDNLALWFTDSSEQLVLLAREDEPAPGAPPGAEFGSFADLTQSEGAISFRGVLRGGGVNSLHNDGIWLADDFGVLSPVALEYGPAAVAGPGITYNYLDGHAINDNGEIAYKARLRGTGVSFANDGVVIGPDAVGTPAILAQEGSQAAGAPAGVTYLGLRDPVLNNARQVAFTSRLSGPGIDASDDEALFAPGAGGALAIVAQRGAPAIDTESGVDFDHFDAITLNESGAVAFRASLTGTGIDGTNDGGLWSADGNGGLSLRFRQGEPAPGLGAGVVTSGFGFFAPVLNDLGDVLTQSFLTGAGIDASNDSALFFAAAEGVRFPVIREGDELEVAPGDLRTVAGFSYYIFGGGVRSLAGRRVAFEASFTDGTSGIFVATLPEPPPEPTVEIDIMPGSDRNSINPASRGILAVAVLGSDIFDAAEVIPATLAFGPGNAAPVHKQSGHFEDVNEDGRIDLVSHFATPETGIAFGDLGACLSGETSDGTAFESCDDIRTVPNCGAGFELAALLPGMMWLRRRRHASSG